MTIHGCVNDALEATIRVIVQDASGRAHEIEALIDTGFNGFITLPVKLIRTLGLTWLFRQQGELADGRIETFEVYQATMIWGESPTTVEVEAVNAAPLVGMGVLNGHSLKIDVTIGGQVAIEKLP
jgi:clan AA aspartic protease